MRMPISKKGNARFRGPTSSTDFNQMEDNKYIDLVELYRGSNENRQLLESSYRTIIAEHIALQDYVEVLESKIKNLEDRFQVLDNTNTYYNGMFFKTGLVSDMTTTYPAEDQDNANTESRADIDVGYRHATLSLNNQIPKTHLLDKNNNSFVPDNLLVKVSDAGAKGTVIENDILHAFDGNNNNFWRREVSYEAVDTPNEERVVLEISLPTNLVNNLNVNTIQVHPHPERGIKIENIEAQYNNTWEKIDGFEQTEIADNKELSPKRKWYFPSRPIQRLRITLVQRNPIQIDNKKVFVLGAQEIGVYYTAFETNSSFVLTPIDMDEVGLYTIESVEHILLNENALSISKRFNDLEGQIYDFVIMKEESGTLIPLTENEWVNQMSKKLWVKTNLYPDPNNSVNPCLHAIRLHYSKA